MKKTAKTSKTAKTVVKTKTAKAEHKILLEREKDGILLRALQLNDRPASLHVFRKQTVNGKIQPISNRSFTLQELDWVSSQIPEFTKVMKASVKNEKKEKPVKKASVKKVAKKATGKKAILKSTGKKSAKAVTAKKAAVG